MKFKVGDYVRIADGFDCEGGLFADNFVGRVDQVFDTGYMVDLDSFCFPAFTARYIKHCERNDYNPAAVFLNESQAEHCEPRESEEAYEEAKRQLKEMLLPYSQKNVLEKEKEQKSEWLKGFLQSKFYAELSERQQAFAPDFLDWYINAVHIIGGGSALLYFYKEMNVEFMLSYFPNVFDVDAALHEDAVVILRAFVEFLEKGISYFDVFDAANWHEFLEEIQPLFGEGQDSPEYAQMKADGVDMKDVELVEKLQWDYLREITKKKFPNLFGNTGGGQEHQVKPVISKKPAPPKVLPPPSLSTDGLKGNDRVTVKYENGLLKQDVKYKQVKEDLEDGLCRLLRR